MGHEFFKSQIGWVIKILRIYGVGHENFKDIWGGSLSFPVPNRGGACIFVEKSGVGHTKLAF